MAKTPDTTDIAQPTGILLAPATWIALLVVVVIAATSYVFVEREKTRERQERERVAAEQAEAERAREIASRAEREKLRFAEEMRIQKEVEEAQRLQAMQQRQNDLHEKRFVADERPISGMQAAVQSYYSQQDQVRREVQDRRDRYAEQESVARARAEVERQKRYLQERDWEEQAARLRRDASARYGR